MSEELWKDVVGFEGLYQFNKCGTLKSSDRWEYTKNRFSDFKRLRVGKTMVPYVDKNGRYRVCLCKKGLPKKFFIHRLMLETFVGPCPVGMEACHINDDPSDNRLENLYWGTREENNKDKIRNGKTAKGEKNGQSKLSTYQVLMIKYMQHLKIPLRKVAKMFNVNRKVIWNIIHEKSWSHV